MTDQTMPDVRPLRPGDPTRLGEYEIVGRLGQGGQGAVFLARPPGGADPVAIKLLHSGEAVDDAARARFVRELAVAKRVARFCTAQVLDADVAGDQPYIVSEYVPGRSLYRLVQEEGPRTGGALERLAISTLTALIAIHQAGIVHRDFKPQNVMMGPDGPRVIDFGVARALDAAGETQNVGTPSYMSPEHFTGDEVGPASDMFAWGTTMVFAANGHPAFGNDDMAAVMHRILTGEPDLGALPSPLREVVADCLAKDPRKRPTARQAQERLVGVTTESTTPGMGAASGAAAAVAPREPAAQGDSPQAPASQASAPQATPSQATVPDGAVAPTIPYAPQNGSSQEAASHQTNPQTTPQTNPQTNPQTTPQPPPFGPSAPPPSGGGRTTHKGKRLVPLIAAAAVVAVVGGGSVWAATRSGGGGSGGDSAAVGNPQSEQTQGDGAGSGSRLNAPSNRPGSASGSPQQTPGTANGKKGQSDQGGQSQQQRRSGGGQTTPGTGGGGGSTTGPTKEPANKYTPQQVCNSGSHGGGYYVQRSLSVSGGRAYLLYNSSGYNCAVLMKTRNVGTRSQVSVWIQRQGGGQVTDSGSYAWYAGPVYVKAPGVCVRFGSGGAAAPYGNCG
ncbi:serine/threonine-protein kinase [Actinomadura sp. NBRC 104425]|uniref:serine/threonine protein kinase n=1 Tax=Actinomadura sp. NBRC 104425 TaxID=3032204 RepID=UPI0025529C1D|nr:serine/threonine-protein kinase [Actinomadura sp. NBRC 104425]